ncbi:SMP-30/gluconolactonase/LRE family protein [Massilia cavernae]|uniref:SMP-30/gluconolactonase/LRE family protein n=1 Tax=Massilia cavernae TaxID=2320864 RepID=A0A418Y701_9BURK|nr:SMP-30/gluconolactonase/LRE family protein [Massilia cavernae]
MERVGAMTCAVGESPVWCARSGFWYWVDITARSIWRFDQSSGRARTWASTEMVACIALDEQGGLVAGMESGIFAVRLPEEANTAIAEWLAAPSADMAGMRFNDGRCDRQGRFWSGTMFLDPAQGRADGSLYRYSRAEGLSAPVVSGLVVQNGLAWSPDGRTMYLSDSHVSRQLIWAFDYDTDTGTPSGQRVFVDMRQHPGRPDGAAIDVDGCYWICANDAGQLHRFTPQGKLDRSVNLPLAKPSMCSFSGADMRTVLVTSISAGAPEGDHLAGAVLTLDLGVAGMAERPFAP